MKGVGYVMCGGVADVFWGCTVSTPAGRRARAGGMDPAGAGRGVVKPGRAGCAQQGAGELARWLFIHTAGGGCSRCKPAPPPGAHVATAGVSGMGGKRCSRGMGGGCARGGTGELALWLFLHPPGGGCYFLSSRISRTIISGNVHQKSGLGSMFLIRSQPLSMVTP